MADVPFTYLPPVVACLKLVSSYSLLRDSKGISSELIGILFGSRSLVTERDPKEIRTSSEGDPKGSRIQPLVNPIETPSQPLGNRCEI